MLGAFKKAVGLSLAALTVSTFALATPAIAAGGTWHGGGHWRGSGGHWHGGGVGLGLGLVAGAVAGAALAAPYYYNGCDPYYGCGYGPASGYAPRYYGYEYAPTYGYGYQGGNSGGANFPQP